VNLNLNLNNKRVGVIRKVDGGFAYFPGGRAKYRGETFATINDVMNDVGAM
jgi:8-oxo-dGTP pyrophosphatase MutT (NUDIX family)